ncbi:hypothetical protein HPB50_022768 [Hyalomma asiaticum]|uniref:Uncharacterized protein n=1 Tax=Hyalomma asiaticum TaxID=266040 RepID=A0ACB7TLX0_HYAAI|nr:hypothetical protein HPB50_022768 [Hyalomma asiaticum]
MQDRAAQHSLDGQPWVPWLHLNIGGPEEVRMSGPMANLLELLAEKLGFDYTIHSPEEHQWGILLPNGEWSGLVGMVFNNKADLALGPVVMTYDRSRVVTFTSQVTTDYLAILAGFPDIFEGSMFGTLMAFEWQVWMGLFCSLLACLLTVFALDSVARGWAIERRGQLGHYWWLFFAALCSESMPRIPTRGTSRVVLAAWWLMALVIMNAFTGHMKAVTMVQSEPDRIDSIKELADRKDIRILIWKGGAYEALFRDSRSVPEYQAVWQTVVRDNSTMDTNSLYADANMADVQRGKTVIVSDLTTLQYNVGRCCRTLRHGTFYFAQEQFFPHKFALAVSQDSDPAALRVIDQRYASR